MPVEGLVGTRVCGCVFVSGQEPRKEDAVLSRWEVMAALTPVVAMATESWDCITERPRGLGGGWMGGPEEVGRTGWLPGVGRCTGLTHR